VPLEPNPTDPTNQFRLTWVVHPMLLLSFCMNPQRKKKEVLVFIFPLIFALVPVVILIASPDVSHRLKFSACVNP
jgi:hypothetical protein